MSPWKGGEPRKTGRDPEKQRRVGRALRDGLAPPEALAELEDARLLKYYFGATKKDMSDAAAGVLVLIVALAVLCTTLFVIVYTLKSLLKGQIAIWLPKSVNTMLLQ